MIYQIFDREIEIETSLIDEPEDEIRKQLDEFSQSERKIFDLTIQFPDSFTGEVMQAMAEIPYGENRSYGWIAEKIGSSAVAVGQACGRNPVPLIVPCHRVTGKDGIGGYAHGTKTKQKLLDLEGADF